ncbi:UNVERIFIED_CONTAM: hypothetical protein HDU68_002290 [Siphonaria sp. JEL0065]|nr:hypothetical protein HDU68_002290 [Siphonaria sp. JEL0065]
MTIKRSYSGDIKSEIRQHLDTQTKQTALKLDTADSLPFDKYWEDIMRTDKDPDYTFNLVNGSSSLYKTPTEIAAESRRLLEGALRSDSDDLNKRLHSFQCADFYQKLDKDGRAVFLKVLARDFGPKDESVSTLSESLRNAKLRKDKSLVIKLEQELRNALDPRFLDFFMQTYQHPGGMRFIIKMREDLVSILPRNHQDPDLKHMNELLKAKMLDWFGISFLDLERITWSSPAEVLEKIIKYEAVHAIPSWESLKERLLLGRACYAFFHKAMPLEPLAFVHVSFETQVSRSITPIISSPPLLKVQDASVAVFYTISSPQKGLSGIDLGNLLIKRVVKEIQTRAPQVTTFTTLSPIPGFRNWLETQINSEVECAAGSSGLLLPGEIDELRKIVGSGDSANGKIGVELLKNLIETNEWITSHESSSAMTIQKILMRLCSRYVLLEKKRSFALDPVANFHIRNGACVYQLNWMGDISEKGVTQSYGIMINYLYDLASLEGNRDRYMKDGVVTVMEGDVGQFGWAIGEVSGRVVGGGKKGAPVLKVLEAPFPVSSKL